MMNINKNLLYVMAAKSDLDNNKRNKKSEKWLPFYIHSYDTAFVMEKLVDEWISPSALKNMGSSSPEETKKLLKLIAMLHDIGKLTAVFQNKLISSILSHTERLKENGINADGAFPGYKNSPHNIAGESILIKYGCPECITNVIGAHHGRPVNVCVEIDCNIGAFPENYYGENNKELWESIWKEWIDISLSYAGYRSFDELPRLYMASQFAISAILAVSDWIASNTSYFPLIYKENYPDNLRERHEKGWKKVGFPKRWSPDIFSIDKDMFCTKFGFPPNEVQKAVIKVVETHDVGLMILEAQTGIGKSESSLAAAEILASKYQCGGIYFGLPSQATANGLFSRIKSWAEEQSRNGVHSFELLHGSSNMNEDFENILKYTGVGEDIPDHGVYVNTWFSQKKTGLLSDFAVGTVDQILLAALSKNHVMMRMLGLMNKVVIIDECHAYDAYMNYYLDRVLNWLGRYNCPVILLSATLPSIRRNELVCAYISGKDKKAAKKINVTKVKGYPLITYTENTTVRYETIPLSSKEKQVKISKLNEENITETIREKLESGGCAGIVVNTVKYAQSLYDKVKEELPEYEVILFHSKFTLADRAKIEDEVVRRVGKKSTPETRNKLIVIGTQVIEQSLDIDFDVMITQLSPMDLFLQRVGRLHRHERIRPELLKYPECFILMDDDAPYDRGTQYIYGKWLLDKTLKSMPETLCIPGDVQDLVELVYQEQDKNFLNEEDKKSYADYKNLQKTKKEKASTFCISEPSSSKFPKVNSIRWTMDAVITNECDAEATVRDGDGAIEVILLKKFGDKIGFVSSQYEGRTFAVSPDVSKEETRDILQQMIRLPMTFNYCCLEAISQLNDIKREIFSNWMGNFSNWMGNFSNWMGNYSLKDELFLVLNEENSAELAGKCLVYDEKTGLKEQKI